MSDAARHVLPFWLGGHRLAFPLEQVVAVLPALAYSELPGAPQHVLGIANITGRLIPVVDLSGRLGWPPPAPSLWQPFVRVRSVRRDLFVPTSRVDAVMRIGPEHFVVGDDPQVASTRLLGIARTPEGMVLIEDVERLLEAEDEQLLDEALARIA